MPQRLKARVVEKKNLAGTAVLVRFVFDEEFFFTPGQYVSLKVADDGSRRSYSIASVPDGKEIELLVDTAPMGLGSKFILGLKEGDSVEVLGPIGSFTVSEPKNNKILFVATGSGIVPFRPMIMDLLEKKKFGGEVYLHWGMRHIKDLFWVDDFKELARAFPNFKFDVVLSQPEGEWRACSGHVNDCLMKHKPDWEGFEAYLCGSQQMIADVAVLLEKLGVQKKDIHFEKFF